MPQHLRRALVFSAVAAMSVLAAAAQDPLTLLPDNYKLVFQNDEVKVIRAHYGPHEKVPVHDHPAYPTVFVYLDSSGAVRIDHQEAGAAPVSITRSPTVMGSYRIAPALAERHSIENLGDTSSDFLRIELKTPLQLEEPFRGKAPQSVAASLDAVEFTNPNLTVERVICAGAEACPVKASSAPSLLVALTPVSLATDGGDQKLAAGAVSWLDASRPAKVQATGDAAAQVLRIVIEGAPRPKPGE